MVVNGGGKGGGDLQRYDLFEVSRGSLGRYLEACKGLAVAPLQVLEGCLERLVLQLHLIQLACSQY